MIIDGLLIWVAMVNPYFGQTMFVVREVVLFGIDASKGLIF